MKKFENFDLLDNEIMQKILLENKLYHEILINQFKCYKLIKREFTGCGYYSTFEIIDKTLKIDEENFNIGNVLVKVAGMDNGIGFILYIADGFINTLECYTFGVEEFPKNIELYEI